MISSAILSALVAAVIFLFPLGLYLLVLAHINRRGRPTLVSGVWDGIGLFFGLCGFYLHTVPSLILNVYQRGMSLENSGRLSVWTSWWLVWAGYYIFLLSGAALLLSMRRHNTVIYNIAPERFPEAFAEALAAEGLRAAAESSDRFAIVPVEASPDFAARSAEVSVDSLNALSHVTLHWDHYTHALRQRVERRLAETLQSAAPEDNFAATLCTGGSGLIFGVISVATFGLILFAYLHSRF